MASQPHVASSSTANKRPAEKQDEMGDLVHRAKASRYSSAKPNDDDESIEDLLEKQLICPICTEIFFDPVLTFPCSHNFCGGCALQWFDTSSRCPSCRTKVTDIKANLVAADTVEILLRKSPDKKREEEALDEMRAIYKPGQKIEINHANDYQSEDDEPEEDEDEDEENYLWPPCPCCDPNNSLGYVCPIPIDTSDGVVRRVVGTEYSQHVKCRGCLRVIPTGWQPYECCCCLERYCGSMFDCLGHLVVRNHLVVRHVKDQDFPVYDLIEMLRTNPNSLVNFNAVELARMLQYFGQSLMTRAMKDELNNSFKSWITDTPHNDEEYLTPEEHLNPESTICSSCVENLTHQKFTRWWVYYQEKNQIVDNREKCWYGYTCRTQIHNRNHAAKLNHACNVTPQNERRSNNRLRRLVGPLPPVQTQQGPAVAPSAAPSDAPPDSEGPHEQHDSAARGDDSSDKSSEEASDGPEGIGRAESARPSLNSLQELDDGI